MSRAMLMTVLARLDGVSASGASAYEQGAAWAIAQGISDGRNPEGQVTREQFVAMLHRYAGSPAATDRELRFSDTEATTCRCPGGAPSPHWGPGRSSLPRRERRS